MHRRGFLAFLGLGAVASAVVKLGIAKAAAETGNTLVYASNQFGSQLTTWGNLEPYHVGDIITIEGVHALDRLTGQPTTALRQFVITAAANKDDRILNFYPPIIPAVLNKHYPNVDTSPRNRARIFIADRANGKWIYSKDKRTLVWQAPI